MEFSASRSSHRPTRRVFTRRRGRPQDRNDGDFRWVGKDGKKPFQFLNIRSWLKKTFLIEIEVFFRIPSLTDWMYGKVTWYDMFTINWGSKWVIFLKVWQLPVIQPEIQHTRRRVKVWLWKWSGPFGAFILVNSFLRCSFIIPTST